MAISVIGGEFGTPHPYIRRPTKPSRCRLCSTPDEACAFIDLYGQWYQVARKPLAILKRSPPRDSFAFGFKPAIVIGKVFGLFAFRGTDKPRFKWLSFSVGYLFLTILSSLGVAVLAVLCTHDGSSTTAQFLNGAKGGVVYMLSTMVCQFLLLRLSLKWPGVMLSLRQMENKLSTSGYPDTDFGRNMRRKTVALVVVTFIIEIIVDAGPPVLSIIEESKVSKIDDIVQRFFYLSFGQAWPFSFYNPVLVLVFLWIKIQAKLAVAYNDLILWAIGTAVAAQFRSLNEKLNEIDFEVMTEQEWRKIREMYNDMLTLKVDIDVILGPHVISSYAIGLWFICGGILLLFDSDLPPVKALYICLSLSFWVIRITVATLAMASVYEENVHIRNTLHQVPASVYGEEVSRFAMQACYDDLGLTGMKFFTVTRSVLMTLAGTVASYEIVLMEFNH